VAHQVLLVGEFQIHLESPYAAARGFQSSPRRFHGLSSSAAGIATRAVHTVVTRPPEVSVSSSSAHAQPRASRSTPFTLPVNTIVSPGNTESFMRNRIQPRRPKGPVQSVT